MPEGYKVVRNIQGLPEYEFFNQNLNGLYDPLAQSSLVAFISENTRVERDDLEDILVGLFMYYPEIEFIFTDAIIDSNGHRFIDYFSGDEIPEVSFFVNLKAPLLFKDQEQSKITAMSSLANKGKLFLHIPDPLLVTYYSL